MNTTDQTKISHSIRTDFVKIVAAFFVIMIHMSDTSGAGGLILNVISRFSVPVFVIASGYHMLHRPLSYFAITKKCVRLLILMFAWSAVFLCYGLLTKTQQIADIHALFQYLFTQPVHLWYLYAAIALYLFTPFLSIFAQNAVKKDYLYTLGITFFLGSPLTMLVRTGKFQTLEIILDKAKIPYLLGFIFLYLLGGYFHKFDVKNAVSRALIYLIGILGTVFTSVFAAISFYNGKTNEQFLSFFAPGAIVAAAAFFLACRHISAPRFLSKPRIHRFFKSVANCTLGIYLMHPLLILIMQHMGLFPAPSGLQSVLLIPTATAAIFLLSAIFTAFGRQIPILRFLFGEKALISPKYSVKQEKS